MLAAITSAQLRTSQRRRIASGSRLVGRALVRISPRDMATIEVLKGVLHMSAESPGQALVVDDSRVSRMMLAALLREQRPGLVIHEAADGAEAVARAEALRPDFVTLDVNMPVMDGFEAAERIRALLPDATLVLLTANVQAASKARAEALGVHFLAKPITEAVVRQSLALWDSSHD